MKNSILLFLLFLIILDLGFSQNQDNLHKLIEAVKNTKNTEEGISEEEQIIAENILIYKNEAINYLLPLLKHPNKNVRDLTSYILRDIDGLEEKHLDALIQSRLNGDGWIPPAIAKIGTPKALRFLEGELKTEKRNETTQLTYAFEILGEKGIPYLIDIFNDSLIFDYDLAWAIENIFRELNYKAELAIDPLIKLMLNKKSKLIIRKTAIRCLAAIGEQAARSIPSMNQLKLNEPVEFQGVINHAFIELKSEEANEYLKDKLQLLLIKKNPNLFDKILFRDIQRIGHNAKILGPILLEFINHNVWAFRLEAVETIDSIGYSEAAPKFIELLKNENDWRIVNAAINSLGKFKTKEALPGLEWISNNHWYPPVRNEAKKAIDLINNKSVSEIHNEQNEKDYCECCIDTISKSEMRELGLFIDSTSIHYLSRGKLSSLKYLGRDRSIGLTYNSSGKVIKYPKVLQTPDRGIEVDDGYLVSSRRGEFGGELVFIGNNNSRLTLCEDNIFNIFKGKFGIIVISDEFYEHSFITKVYKNKNGKWGAVRWKSLPGSYISSYLLDDGKLLINCYGGNVLFYPDGKLEIVYRK
jgi:HEAT repeat protein